MTQSSLQTTLERQERLIVEPGTPAELRVSGSPHGLRSAILGMEHGSYVILRGGELGREMSLLSPGEYVLVRFVCQNQPWGFDARLLGVQERPFPLIYLSYPKSIFREEQRRFARLPCRLRARMDLRDRLALATVRDISEGGCRLVCHERLDVQVGDTVGLLLPLTDPRRLSRVRGEVRALDRGGQAVNLGISFKADADRMRPGRQDAGRATSELHNAPRN